MQNIVANFPNSHSLASLLKMQLKYSGLYHTMVTQLINNNLIILRQADHCPNYRI